MLNQWFHILISIPHIQWENILDSLVSSLCIRNLNLMDILFELDHINKHMKFHYRQFLQNIANINLKQYKGDKAKDIRHINFDRKQFQ